jgi:hypothetical protein
MLTLPGFFTDLGGARLTVFGSGASQMAQLALLVTTVCAAILLCATLVSARRLDWICGYAGCRLERKAGSRLPRSDKLPGLWEGCGDRPVTFAATPVLARLRDGGTALSALFAKPSNRRWASQLARLLRGSSENADRLAWFALLAAQMSLFRWAAAGSVMSALASVIIVYLYPIESDPLVLLNLAILVCIGIFSAYKTTSFERNEILSNILCNRPKKLEVSTSFFMFIAAPFIALAAAIVIVAIPGVVDWAGGLFAMLGALGVHP